MRTVPIPAPDAPLLAAVATLLPPRSAAIRRASPLLLPAACHISHY